jgi:hypothetical protein
VTKTAEEIREELSKRKKKTSGRPWTSFDPGEWYFRIGPPWEKDGEVWKDVLFHGDFKNKVYCGKNDVDEKTGKPGKCKACRRWEEVKKERSPVAKALFGLLRQKSESIWNILRAKVKKHSDGTIEVRKYEDRQFKLLRLSAKWQNLVLEIFSDDDYRRKSVLGVAHPKYGRLIRVKREGKGRDDTDYHFKVMEKETPISSDEHERHKLLKTLTNLDEIVSASSSEEIETFVAKMEKVAKHIAAEEDGSDYSDDSSDADKSDASDDSDASDKSEDSSDKSDNSDHSEDSSDEDDLEKQYKELQRKIERKKKQHHHHHH